MNTKDITHDYIRAIVGTEPQEWWPDLYFDPEIQAWMLRGSDRVATASVAYHAFVGAAVEWLAERGSPWSSIRMTRTDASGYELQTSNYVGSFQATGSDDLLATLVAAIREVKQ